METCELKKVFAICVVKKINYKLKVSREALELLVIGSHTVLVVLTI